jgi:hypothetical protein
MTRSFKILHIFLIAAALLLLGGSTQISAQGTNADGDLRLVDTTAGTVVDTTAATGLSGRLEIFDDTDGDGTGTWKGICDDFMEPVNGVMRGAEEAQVACRQLGLSGGTPMTRLTVPESTYSSDYYLLDELECTGSETRILGQDKCRHRPRGENNCFSIEAFGVTCAAATTSLNSTATGRLTISGTTETGQTMTSDRSGVTDEDGMPSEESSFSYQWIRVGYYDYSETEISEATSSTYVLQSADEDHWIKVKLSFADKEENSEEISSFPEGPVYPDVSDGTLRLSPTSDSSDDYTGMLEIFDKQKKRWKGVCDDGWGTEEAQVACSQLGFSGNTPKTDIIRTGWPPLLFLLDEVDCDGTEETLLDCDHAERGVNDCVAWEYAGVSCEAPSEPEVSPTQ